MSIFNDLIEYVANDKSITDLHLRNGEYPVVRKAGRLERLNKAPFYRLYDDELWKIFEEIVPDKEFKERFTNERDLDISYNIGSVARFRVNIAKDFNGISFSIRKIPYNPPNIYDLKLPKYFDSLIKAPDDSKITGLILVVGPTGSGKTTLLASMIETINQKQHKNIILLEDPIEYVFESKQSIIMQREIGRHTRNFMTGIIAAKREDPDVVMIGEMRTAEAIESVLNISESGHLVFSTLHTGSIIETVDTIVSSFESNQQPLIRLTFSRVAKAIISSKIIYEGNKAFSAPETLFISNRIREYIRNWSLDEIKKAMEDELNRLKTIKHRIYYPREEHLIDLYKEKLISKETLLKYSRENVLLKLAEIHDLT